MRWLLLALILVACSKGKEPGQELVLQGFRPLQGQQILLNEPLSLTFSRDLDPSSITPSSLWVEDDEGRPCQGQWRLQGSRWLRFWPRTVTGSNLSGGGYRPGRAHVVRVVGFPGVGGLRAVDGEPLDRCYRIPFEVVDPGPNDQAFLDFSPYGCEPLVVGVQPSGVRAPVQEGEPIRMWCAEPLDPRSVHSEDFSIWFHPWNPKRDAPKATPYCGVRLTLLQNRHSELLLQNEAAAVFECTPEEVLDPRLNGQFSLRVERDARLIDFSGHSPWPEPGATGPRSEFYFRVEPVDAHGQSQLRLDFLDAEHLSTQEIPWAVGEAHLQPGRLTVAMPTCVGLGERGKMSLDGPVQLGDHPAVKMTVPLGMTATLPKEPGSVVLRSQGAWRQFGALQRRTGSEWKISPGDWVEQNPGSSVDELLQFASEEDCNWTVLVAGGDLVLKGDFEVDTPVVLIAAGRVRIEGRISCPPGELYKVGDGGGSSGTQSLQTLSLTLPEAGMNPLREAQRYAMVTSSLPRWVADRFEWDRLSVGARDGGGRAEVLFLPSQGPVELDRCVTHPRALPPFEPLRILILLTVEPGGKWDPPSVDFIHLSWRVL